MSLQRCEAVPRQNMFSAPHASTKQGAQAAQARRKSSLHTHIADKEVSSAKWHKSPLPGWPRSAQTVCLALGAEPEAKRNLSDKGGMLVNNADQP